MTSLDLHKFSEFFDSVEFVYAISWWGGECEDPVDICPYTLPLYLLLFEEYFVSLEFKSYEEVEWESELFEPQNDRTQSLDSACLNDFTRSINPLKALKKIKQVDLLAAPIRQNKQSQGKTYHQDFMYAALTTGNSISATVSIYCSHSNYCIPILIDTGASVSVTSVLTDFIRPLRPCATANLKRLSGTIEVIGEGTVNLLVRDMFGNKRKIRTTSY
jgi:hypothetical protein